MKKQILLICILFGNALFAEEQETIKTKAKAFFESFLAPWRSPQSKNPSLEKWHYNGLDARSSTIFTGVGSNLLMGSLLKKHRTSLWLVLPTATFYLLTDRAAFWSDESLQLLKKYRSRDL